MNRILTIFAICLMMASCQKNEPAYKAKLDINPDPYDLEFDRYEVVLFSLDTNDFQVELMNVQDRYHVFLGGDLNNPDAVQYLKDFATDPFSITLYEKVKAVFSDLKQIEPVVEDVFAHFHYYYPEIELPKKAFTCSCMTKSECQDTCRCVGMCRPWQRKLPNSFICITSTNGANKVRL